MTPTRRVRLRRGEHRSERGAIIVVTAIFMSVALMVAALVLDLAQLRQDRAWNRRTADLMATAAATTLATPGGTGTSACTAAWEYFLVNTDDEGSVSQVPPCSTTFSSACNPATARNAIGRAGPYTVTITYPVPYGSSLLNSPDVVGGASQQFNGTADGTACERVGVRISRDRAMSFATVMSISESSTTSRSVARATSQFDQGGIIALLLLEQTSCDALTASGQAQVIVEQNGPKPGYITVDSSATGGSGSHACNNSNRWAVDAIGTQNSAIIAEGSAETGAPGIIRMFALAPGQGNAKAYEPADITGGRLSPTPLPASRRIGRNPIDWRWNCTGVGRDNVGGTSDDCRLPPAPRINDLRTSLGGNGAPVGYQTYPRDNNDSCNLQPSDGAVVLPPGNWWINCPSGFKVANQVQFVGGNFVFQNGVEVGSGGSLTINVGNSGHSVVYLRNGDLTKDAQATLRMNETIVYLHSGRITMGAGSGQLEWTAPRTDHFEDLALWSESTLQHDLGGQASLLIEGVFFTPNADPFSYTGQSLQEQRVNAQFITRRMEVSGQGALRLQPTAGRVAVLPAWGAALIR